MIFKKQLYFDIRSEAGVFLIDMLTGLFVSSLILLSVSFTYLNTTRTFHDNSLRIDTELKANTILSNIADEFKFIGSGVPLNQDEFSMSDSGLGDASLPVSSFADSSTINIKVNKAGRYSMLSADYTPSAFDLTFDVYDVSIFEVGDKIYISNFSRAGEQALYGEITNITGNTLSIDSSYTASTSASFEEGSNIYPIRLLEYTSSPSDWSGISREIDSGTMITISDSRLTLSYYDANGNALSTPLSRSDIANNLSLIHLKVEVTSRNKMKDGSFFLATAEQDVSLRNLVLSRQ